MKSVLKNSIIFFLSMILILVLLLTSFNAKVYELELYDDLQEKNGVYEHFGNASLVKEKSAELVSFFRTDSALDSGFYTQKEISHLDDVKRLFVFLKIAYWILVLLLVLGLIYAYFRYEFSSVLIDIISIQLILCLLLVILSYAIPFDPLFDKMHGLLFPQGNYSFDPASSNMINLFPVGFFIGFFNEIMVGFMIYESMILILLLVLYIKKNINAFKIIFK